MNRFTGYVNKGRTRAGIRATSRVNAWQRMTAAGVGAAYIAGVNLLTKKNVRKTEQNSVLKRKKKLFSRDQKKNC